MSDMLFSKDHIWVQKTDDGVRLGITDYAQEKLGAVLFVTLPSEGDDVQVNDRFGDVESVKTVSDLISPVDGIVISVNDALEEEPDTINESPYEAWLVEVKVEHMPEKLMEASAYEIYKETL